MNNGTVKGIWVLTLNQRLTDTQVLLLTLPNLGCALRVSLFIKSCFGLQLFLVSFSLSSGVCIITFMSKVAQH